MNTKTTVERIIESGHLIKHCIMGLGPMALLEKEAMVIYEREYYKE